MYNRVPSNSFSSSSSSNATVRVQVELCNVHLLQYLRGNGLLSAAARPVAERRRWKAVESRRREKAPKVRRRRRARGELCERHVEVLEHIHKRAAEREQAIALLRGRTGRRQCCGRLVVAA